MESSVPRSLKSDAAVVLLVDADEARAATTRSALASGGAEVVGAMSVAQALAAVRGEAVALALIESQVGDIDGVALARVVRQEPGGRNLPLILLADATPDPKWLARAAEAGVLDVVVRPGGTSMLGGKVAHLLRVGAEGRAATRQNAEVERRLRSNELMVAGLIHDLRTPLMAINLSAEVALVRSQDEAVQQAARRIRSSTVRMARLYDHLLNLSRVGPPVARLDVKAADLKAVAEAVVDDVRAARPDARIDLSSEGSLEAVFDAELLRRSLGELIALLLQHGVPGEPVTVRLDGTHADRIWIQASMAAVVPAEVQEGLFVPGPTRAGREVPGFGLGLHRIDGWLRAQGGSVVGRSRSPEGTVFELLMPRDASGS